MSKWILGYFIVLNILSAVLTIADKSFAKRGKWRISENTLIFTAVLGGSLAEYIVMRIIHHKTLHKKFMVGLPLILFLQAVLIFVVLYFAVHN